MSKVGTEILAQPGNTTFAETGISVANHKNDYPIDLHRNPLRVYSFFTRATSPQQKEGSKMNTVEITVTGFDFRTGEYTTHTETVELN